MVASEHTDVIEGRQMLITTYVLDPEDRYEYGYIDDYGDALGGEVESASGEACVSTCVNEVGKKEVEEVHQDMNSSSI